MTNRLSAAMEDYLEAIAFIEKQKGDMARVSEIACILRVRKPTVNAALKKLCQKSLIRHERYGKVELTEKGKRMAAEVQGKHDIIKEFLVSVLGVDKMTASEDACRMEHSVSPETLGKLTGFIEEWGMRVRQKRHGVRKRVSKNDRKDSGVLKT